jgi:hypothetical protein
MIIPTIAQSQGEDPIEIHRHRRAPNGLVFLCLSTNRYRSLDHADAAASTDAPILYAAAELPLYPRTIDVDTYPAKRNSNSADSDSRAAKRNSCTAYVDVSSTDGDSRAAKCNSCTANVDANSTDSHDRSPDCDHCPADDNPSASLDAYTDNRNERPNAISDDHSPDSISCFDPCPNANSRLDANHYASTS